MYEIILTLDRDNKRYWIEYYKIHRSDKEKHQFNANSYNTKSLFVNIYLYYAMSEYELKTQLLHIRASIDSEWSETSSCSMLKVVCEND